MAKPIKAGGVVSVNSSRVESIMVEKSGSRSLRQLATLYPQSWKQSVMILVLIWPLPSEGVHDSSLGKSIAHIQAGFSLLN